MLGGTNTEDKRSHLRHVRYEGEGAADLLKGEQIHDGRVSNLSVGRLPEQNRGSTGALWKRYSTSYRTAHGCT